MPHCFAPNCNHNSLRETCRFFRFPKSETTFAKWKKNTRRADRDPKAFDSLCSCHFVDGKKENDPTIFRRNGQKKFAFLSPEKRLSSELEPIDPKFLIAFIEKTKNVVVSGQCTVKLPVGPDEYVTQDGAEYLRGLGYHNTLIEEEVLDVPKRVSAEEIDVLGPASPSRLDEEAPLPIIPQNSHKTVRKTSPEDDSDLDGEGRDRQPSDTQRQILNNLDKMRRRQMTEYYEYLWNCIHDDSSVGYAGSKYSRISLLADSASVISELIDQEKALTSLKSQELSKNLTLKTMVGETRKTQLLKKMGKD